MTDIQEMVQQTNMSNVNYIENSDTTEDSLQVVKEFKLYYEKFVGYPVEDGQFYQEAVDLFSSAYRKQPIWSHPLARTALIGAGSLAATVGIGLTLSHDAANRTVVDQPIPPAAPPSQPSYSEQTSRTSPVPQIASPALARVEFSNLQADPPPALNQPGVAVSPRIKLPLPAPFVVQPIGQIEAIAQPAAGQALTQANATSSGQTTAQSQSAQNPGESAILPAVSSASSQVVDRSASLQNAGSGAIAPPQPISAGNTPLRTVLETGTPAETDASAKTGETPLSQLTPALPPWVNSNLAPVGANPSEPSEPSVNGQNPPGIEAQSNQRSNQQTETSAEPSPLDAGQNPDSAQSQTDSVWEVSSSLTLRPIVFRNQGIAQPEASVSHPMITRGAQAIAAPPSQHPNQRKSIAAKPERPTSAR